MDKFLDCVASYLFDKFQNDLSEVTVVFPNRRAGLFFQKYLSQRIDKPLFSPRILTITDLITEFSDLKIDDPNSLIIRLWETFTEVTSSTETIDDFFFWGEMLLSDFNDVDMYLVDAQKLFKNIESLKEIDMGFDFLSEEQILFLSSFWKNILEVRSSADKNNFLNNWNHLYTIYSSFREKLLSEGIAYSGMVYRDMVENMEKKSSLWENRKVAIVGFNALNQCERKLFRFFKTHQADFFWDYDQYYLSANHHEAAFFMTSNLVEFPMPDDFYFQDHLFAELTEIDLVAVPGFSGQAQYTSHWLTDNQKFISSAFDNTAIVLCDESLLVPMLNALPQVVDDVNITMGFPLKNSPVFSFFKGLVDLDRNSRKNNEGINLFYFRNVLVLLNHPLLRNSLGDFIDWLSERIQKENKIYLNRLDFAENELLTTVFNLPDDVFGAIDYLQRIVVKLFPEIPEADQMTKEALYQFYLLTNRVNDSFFSKQLKQKEHTISKKLFYQLLLRSAERLSIPFEGEPLCGLQIMGFLETRCLDFDNLIVLSFNDDKLPGNANHHSFIPYSLRKGFDLPVIEHRNAMYSYYFYRLIQRAKKVTLVYDSRNDGMVKGEVSRYATQLKYEAQHLKLMERQAVFNFDSFEGQSVTIPKTSSMMQKLESAFLSRTISPTMLSTYLDCRLKFYFRYVEDIRESDEVFEEIDPMIFGRIAHLTMEGIYSNFVGKEILPDEIKRLIADKKTISFYLAEALKKEFFKGGSFDMNGKNLLIFDIIEKYILKILHYDLTIAPFKILALEKEFCSDFELLVNGQTRKVKVGGTIDRLDQTENCIRVVDYKTGKSESSVRSIESLFMPSDKRNKAAFQTMIYAHCVAEKLGDETPVVPAVYGARAVFTSDFNPVFQMNGHDLIYQRNSDEFKTDLLILLAEIVNPDIPFSQTENEQKCNYCPYNLLCNREGS
ncbi:MAG TPA: PD-(D/E)XK nuclease family protein [Prolixibacteraceae bacterium]|nr:PD-(D/E)XK nuclease family protein [Prolixibacteraceae bacterium]